MKSATRRSFVVATVLAAAFIASPIAAQDIKGKLVLYTSQPERDATQTVAGFRRVHPGVEVEVFRSGTTEVMGKLAAEFAAGQPKPIVPAPPLEIQWRLLRARQNCAAHIWCWPTSVVMIASPCVIASSRSSTCCARRPPFFG